MIRDRAIIAKAISVGLATEEEIAFYFRSPEPDPYAGLDPEQRLEACIRACASGAPAELPTAVAEIDGRPVLVPPGYRAHRGPRGRSPKGRHREPPASQNVTEEGTAS